MQELIQIKLILSNVIICGHQRVGLKIDNNFFSAARTAFQSSSSGFEIDNVVALELGRCHNEKFHNE